MKAIISSAKLREVFPAFVIIDASGRILDFGPAIEIHASSVRAGDFLENHFSGNLHMIPKKWEEMARENGRALELHSRENGLVLTGVVVADSDRFLLALNPATASLNSGGSKAGANPAPDLHISDFTPGDPAVDSLLLGWMHQAMLEDAAALATSLARERQRNDGLVERVSRLAGFLAHDFNNILSIIQLNANRLASLDSISTQGKRLASMIGETAERGSGITRSLMTISRENTEKPAPHSADDLITQHLSYFSAIAGSDIVVSANLDASSAQINISISEFINCLTNLVINSRDAICDPGVIEITTRIIGSFSEDDFEELEITVSDTGIGMPENILSRVFEPFFSTKKQGNGIGLKAVADYAKECGGDVRLESKPGQGTKVSLSFPLILPNSKERASEISENTDTTIRSARISNNAGTVLLVEDEPYALEALVEMLEAEGFEVWPAHSAEEAARRLDAEQALSRLPSILLTDVVLPGKSGIELARTATAKAPNLKVILMSGFIPADHKLESAWLFAPKPLNSDRLMQMLRN